MEKKIIFVEKNSMFLVRHIEPKNLVRLAWIARKFLKTENIPYPKIGQIIFFNFKNFLLLHANLTKLIGSLCWTLNVTFFSTKHFSLAFGRKKGFFLPLNTACFEPGLKIYLSQQIKMFVFLPFFHHSLNHHKSNRFGVSF